MPMSLPTRAGPRPRVTPCAPHGQLDQFPAESLTPALLARVRRLEGVSLGTSLRAPPGTVGFFLPGAEPRGSQGSEEVADELADAEEDFMLGREFAHVHPEPDGSLHLVMAEPLRRQALQAGWVEAHPLAGRPTVPRSLVLAYAPRDEAELEVVFGFVEAAWRRARRQRNRASPHPAPPVQAT